MTCKGHQVTSFAMLYMARYIKNTYVCLVVRLVGYLEHAEHNPATYLLMSTMIT